jgi:uncharacterized membrane protein YwzB
METFLNSSEKEFENGTYIRTKTPHESFSGNQLDPFVSDQKYQQAFYVFLYVVIFLLGIVVGSIFHDRLMNSNSSQLVWKSSNLMQSDRK